MKKFIKKLFEFAGYSIINTKILKTPQKQKPITRDDFFNLYFSKIDSRDFFFVQIGANDGKSADPLYPYVSKYNLSGLVVEPLPDAFARLQDTYRDSKRITFVNAAIGITSGTMTFYTVKESAKTAENWFAMTRIASFNKAVIRESLFKKILPGANTENYIQETPIKTLSFGDLIQQYNLKKIDMLQIDCEGYDYEILKTVDFGRLSPSLLNFESCHFSDRDRKECEDLLTSKGYKFFRYDSDTCAYKC